MLTGKKIVIAGGSGFIGQAMAARWADNNSVIILTRAVDEPNNAYGGGKPTNVQYISWDARSTGTWTAALKGADILINLCGKSVNCRYTSANKRGILESRVGATEALGAAVRQSTLPPKLWINMSSATIYRNAADRPQDELNGEMYNDFSVQVCKAWEAAFYRQQLPYTRQVALRAAIVLGKYGVMVPFRRLVAAGLGGAQGTGRQMFSWIHMEDLLRIIEWITDHESAEGTYNASAPGPVSNREFMDTLRQRMNVPAGISIPAWMLRLGALIIGTETELLLKSRWVVPRRLLEEGFTFRYPAIAQALSSLLESTQPEESAVPAIR